MKKVVLIIIPALICGVIFVSCISGGNGNSGSDDGVSGSKVDSISSNSSRNDNNNSDRVSKSDLFIGEWIQVADVFGYNIQKDEMPWELRISKGEIFYFVEVLDNGKYREYPSGNGKYLISDNKKYLINVKWGAKFSIQYRDDSNSLFENAWLGYFKRK